MRKHMQWGLFLLTLIISGCMLMMSQTFYAATEEEQASLSDVSGNWAETQINDWVSKGLAKGDLNDTFRPNHTIT